MKRIFAIAAFIASSLMAPGASTSKYQCKHQQTTSLGAGGQ